MTKRVTKKCQWNEIVADRNNIVMFYHLSLLLLLFSLCYVIDGKFCIQEKKKKKDNILTTQTHIHKYKTDNIWLYKGNVHDVHVFNFYLFNECILCCIFRLNHLHFCHYNVMIARAFKLLSSESWTICHIHLRRLQFV